MVEAHVGRAVRLRRRADCQENDLSTLHRRLYFGREVKPAVFDVLLDDLIKSRFIDRDDAVVQLFDLCNVDINACDIDTEFCETRTGDQTNVTGTNDCNVHNLIKDKDYK